jgi:hypothetical protein
LPGKLLIFLKEYNGKPVFVISLNKEFNSEIRIIQPEIKSDLEARVEQLEKKFYTLLKSESKGKNT